VELVLRSAEAAAKEIEEAEEWEAAEVTVEEARYVISMLNALSAVEAQPPIDIYALDLEALSSSLMGIADPIGQIAKWLGDQLNLVASWVTAAVRAALDTLWSTFIQPAISAVSGGIDWLRGLLTKAYETLSNLATQLPAVVDLLRQGLAALGDLTVRAIPGIVSTLRGLADAVGAIPGLVQQVLAALSKSFSDLWGKVSSAIGGVAAAVGDLAGRLGRMLSDLAGAVAQGFASLGDRLGWLWQQVQLLGAALQRALQPLLEGVTKGFAEVGRLLVEASRGLGQLGVVVQGFVNAVLQLPERIRDFFRWIADAVLSIPQAVGGIVSALAQLPERIRESVDRILSGISAVVAVLGQIPAAISESIPKLVQQISEWGRGFLDAIVRTFGTIKTALERFLADPLGTIYRAVMELFAMIAGILQPILEPVQKAVSDFIEWARGGIDWLRSQLSLENLRKSLEDFFTWLKNTLPSICRVLPWPLSSLCQMALVAGQLLTSPPEKWGEILGQVTNLWKTILPSGIVDFFDKAAGILKDAEEKIKNFIKNPVEKIWKVLNDLWQKIYNAIPQPIRTFLENVKNAIATAGTKLYTWITKPETFWDDLAWLVGQVAGWVRSAAEKAWGAIQGALDFVKSFLGKGAEALLGMLTGALGLLSSVMRSASGAVMGAVKSLASLASALLEQLVGLTKATVPKMRDAFVKIFRGEVGEIEIPFLVYATMVPTIALVYSLRHLFGYFSHLGSLARKALESACASIPYVGNILKGIVHNIFAPLDKALYTISEQMKEMTVRLPEAIVFATAFAWARPLEAAIRWIWKNFFRMTTGWDLVFEIPGIGEMRNIMQRLLPQVHGYDVVVPEMEVWLPLTQPLQKTRVKMDFGFWLQALQRYFDMYGYPDALTRVFTALSHEFYTTVKDRFGVERKVPLGTLYELPPFGDLARMMVRDLFASVDEFAKVSAARGMHPDIAKLYYIFHFKYPPLEKLWEFYNRAQANVLWFRPTREEYERAAREAASVMPPELASSFTPVAPADLNVMGRSDVAARLLNALTAYVKWNDYAAWAWIQGFTSDKWLVTDLLADIPGRIDARWMYKWMVPDYVAEAAGFPRLDPRVSYSEQVMGQIVIARAMNPMFVPMVSIAEMMNALTEERTLFRTGIINAFRRCFTTFKNMWDALSGLFTLDFWAPFWNPSRLVFEWKKVTVPVRFLEGEAKLLVMRALYDRADIYFRDFRRQLIAMITDNYDSPEKLPEYLRKVVEDLNKRLAEYAKALGAERALVLEYDSAMAAFDVAYASLRRDHRTMTRSRGWLRAVLYRLWQRFQMGYISEEEMKKYIDDLVKAFRLTDQEREFFLETARLFRELHRRQTLAKNVLRKLRQGLITEDEAVNALVKLGFDRETAQAEVEAELKVYTPSITTLAQLVELVPEAMSLFEKVCKRMGVPDEEKNYWLLYVQRKAVKDEVSRLVTELIADYAKGIITDQEWSMVMQELKKFGYTDQEIELLTLIAKLRRARALAK
jgi:phage-related protein